MNQPSCYQHRHQFLLVIIVQFVGNVVCDTTTVSIRENENDYVDEENMPSDFANFMNGLGSLVYNKQKKTETTAPRTHMTSPIKHALIKNTEGGAALSDLLMLKLVSYYEDKYKVAHNSQPESTVNMDMLPGILEDNLVTPTSYRNVKRRTPSKRITADHRFKRLKPNNRNFKARPNSRRSEKYQHQSSDSVEESPKMNSEETVLYL